MPAVAAISQAKGRSGVFSASRFRAAFFFGKRKKYAEIGRDHCSCGRLCVGGIPLIVLILGVGHLSDGAAGIPARPQAGAARSSICFEKEEGAGEVSSFGALCTALSATIGTGNIVGVATAICAGGPGALFWMWLAAFFRHGDQVCGGPARRQVPQGLSRRPHPRRAPFIIIENGLGKRWKFLAVIFAVLGMCVGLFGIGTFSQVNSITGAVNNVFDGAPTVTLFGGEYSIAVVIGGLLVAAAVALVLLGGVKRIAKVSEMVVPFMVILYVLICLIILGANVTAIPQAFCGHRRGRLQPAGGRGRIAGSMLVAMQQGIARGIFSNEAGLASAPIAAAAAKTKEPVRQGPRSSMTGTFLDTLVVCTMTGLAIVITGAWKPEAGLEGGQRDHRRLFGRAARRAGQDRPRAADGPASFFFAFTTILGWNFYGERCLEYIVGRKKGRHLYLPHPVHPRRAHRAVHDGRGGLEHRGHLQRADGDPQPHRARPLVGRRHPRDEGLFPPVSRRARTPFPPSGRSPTGGCERLRHPRRKGRQATSASRRKGRRTPRPVRAKLRTFVRAKLRPVRAKLPPRPVRRARAARERGALAGRRRFCAGRSSPVSAKGLDKRRLFRVQ